MSKAGHRAANVCAAAVVAAIAPNPLGITTALAIAAGSSLPDSLEGVYAWSSSWFSSREERHSLIPHRTLTHWWVLWFALALVAIVGLHFRADVLAPAWGFALLLGMAIGSLIHLLLDAFSPMGIPMLHPFGPRRRIAVVYTTGSVRELLVLAPFALVAVITIALRWHGIEPQFAHTLLHIAVRPTVAAA